MMRGPIDFFLPEPKVLSDNVKQCEVLLGELQKTMLSAEEFTTDLQNPEELKNAPFTFGKFLREPIFYGAIAESW